MSIPTSADHVAPQVRPLLGLDGEQRLAYMQRNVWIEHTRANQTLKLLEDLLVHPRTHRMPNLLIIGDTNNGKTMIVQRFARLHPCRENAAGDGNLLPVLYVACPTVPDEKKLYNRILRAINAPYKPNDRLDAKEDQVLRLLRRLQVQILVLDEIHHILEGSTNRQRQFLNLLKDLGNQLQIPLVAVGIHSALNAISTDPQLANRFRPVFLPRWEAGEEWDRLLASFERRMPLRLPSNLLQPPISMRLLTMSEGLIGEVWEILTRAARDAMTSERERVTAAILDRIDWTPPSRRNRPGSSS